MSTISSLTSSSANGYSTLATSSTAVSQTSNSGLVQAAATLSAEGSIVASLGGSSTSGLTYDAAGILNSFLQAGSLSSSSQTTDTSSNPQATAQNSTDQNIVSSLASSNSATSGVYNASGLLQGISSDTSSNWVTALKANPSLSSSVISDSFNQGIIGTLSTSA